MSSNRTGCSEEDSTSSEPQPNNRSLRSISVDTDDTRDRGMFIPEREMTASRHITRWVVSTKWVVRHRSHGASPNHSAATVASTASASPAAGCSGVSAASTARYPQPATIAVAVSSGSSSVFQCGCWRTSTVSSSVSWSYGYDIGVPLPAGLVPACAVGGARNQRAGWLGTRRGSRQLRGAQRFLRGVGGHPVGQPRVPHGGTAHADLVGHVGEAVADLGDGIPGGAQGLHPGPPVLLERVRDLVVLGSDGFQLVACLLQRGGHLVGAAVGAQPGVSHSGVSFLLVLRVDDFIAGHVRVGLLGGMDRVALGIHLCRQVAVIARRGGQGCIHVADRPMHFHTPLFAAEPIGHRRQVRPVSVNVSCCGAECLRCAGVMHAPSCRGARRRGTRGGAGGRLLVGWVCGGCRSGRRAQLVGPVDTGGATAGCGGAEILYADQTSGVPLVRSGFCHHPARAHSLILLTGHVLGASATAGSGGTEILYADQTSGVPLVRSGFCHHPARAHSLALLTGHVFGASAGFLFPLAELPRLVASLGNSGFTARFVLVSEFAAAAVPTASVLVPRFPLLPGGRAGHVPGDAACPGELVGPVLRLLDPAGL